MIGEKMMDQKAFIESIDSTIDRLKKEIRFYNRVIGIGNIIKIVLSASIPIAFAKFIYLFSGSTIVYIMLSLFGF